MEIIRLSRQQIDDIYNERLKEDFPMKERRPLRMIHKALDKSEYECFGLGDQGEICGYAFFVKHNQDYLFDYLAIDKTRRDGGLGTIFLKLLKEELSDARSVVGEVEDPDTADTEDERAYRMKRLSFYLKNACRDTGVKADAFGVRYRIIEIILSEADEHDEDMIREIYANHYRTMLPALVYKSMIKLPE